MHRLLVIALLATVTACADITTIKPIAEELTTDGDFAGEYTTVDTIANLKSNSSDGAAYDRTSKFQAMRKRRIGGRDTDEVKDDEFEDSFAYVVALYDAEDNYVCVGSILNLDFILTARHCLEPDPVAYVRALTRDSYKGGEKREVEESFLYGKGHDIALLSLKQRITRARPLTLLPPNIEVPVGDKVLALGWGRMKNDSWPRYLMKVDSVVSPVEECWNSYGSQDLLCTETKISYTCYGDSGGPILYRGKQVGIISRSLADECGSGFPSANINLKKYWNWIQLWIHSQLAGEPIPSKVKFPRFP